MTITTDTPQVIISVDRYKQLERAEKYLQNIINDADCRIKTPEAYNDRIQGFSSDIMYALRYRADDEDKRFLDRQK